MASYNVILATFSILAALQQGDSYTTPEKRVEGAHLKRAGVADAVIKDPIHNRLVKHDDEDFDMAFTVKKKRESVKAAAVKEAIHKPDEDDFDNVKKKRENLQAEASHTTGLHNDPDASHTNDKKVSVDQFMVTAAPDTEIDVTAPSHVKIRVETDLKMQTYKHDNDEETNTKSGRTKSAGKKNTDSKKLDDEDEEGSTKPSRTKSAGKKYTESKKLDDEDEETSTKSSRTKSAGKKNMDSKKVDDDDDEAEDDGGDEGPEDTAEPKDDLSCPHFIDFLEGSHSFWDGLRSTKSLQQKYDVTKVAMKDALEAMGKCFQKIGNEISNFLKTNSAKFLKRKSKTNSAK